MEIVLIELYTLRRFVSQFNPNSRQLHSPIRGFLIALQEMLISKNKIIFLLILFELFFSLIFIWPHMEVNPYLMRDILRATALLSGKIIFVGPDTIGGGYSPGPFFYILLAPILVLSSSYKFVCLCFLLLRLPAHFYLSALMERITKTPAWFFYLGYLLFLLFLTALFWPTNASFVEILFPFGIYVSYRFFQSTGSAELKYWVLSAFCVGLASQVHYSMLHWSFLFLILLIQKRKGAISFLIYLALYFFSLAVACAPFLYFKWLNHLHPEIMTGLFPNHLDLSFFTNRWRYSYRQLFSFDWSKISERRIEAIFISLYLGYAAIAWPLLAKKQFPSYLYSLVLCALIIVALHGGWTLGILAIDGEPPHRYLELAYCFAVLPLMAELWPLTLRPVVGKLLIAFCFFMLGHHAYALWAKLPDRLDYNNITLSDMDSLCAHFNERHVNFLTFRFNAFEIQDPLRNESSFELLGHCFMQKGPLNLEHPYRYLLVKKSKTPPDFWPPLWQKQEELELETKNFFLYKRTATEGAREIFSTNLNFSYDIDPAILNNSESPHLPTGLYDELTEGTDIYEARLCDHPALCSAFLFVRAEKDHVNVLLVSRSLQTKWAMPPMPIHLTNVKLQYLCGSEENSTLLAASIGTDDIKRQNRTVNPPLLFAKSKCERFRPLSLTADLQETMRGWWAKETTQFQEHPFRLIEPRISR